MGSLPLHMRFRLVSFSLLAMVFLTLAASVSAVEEAPEGTPGDGSAEVVSDYQPAVEVDLRAGVEAGQEPWTTRFLVPTTVVLGALVVFVTVVQYFTKVVRARYKVVE